MKRYQVFLMTGSDFYIECDEITFKPDAISFFKHEGDLKILIGEFYRAGVAGWRKA